MSTVLHFRSRYLRPSETFIDRLVRGHRRYRPVIATVTREAYTDGLDVVGPWGGRTGAVVDRAAIGLDRSPTALHRAILGSRPAVVHAHFGIDGYRAMHAAIAHHVPLVVTFHGHDVTRLPREPRWRRRYARLARGAASFLVVSDDLRRTLVDELGFPAERTRTAYVGIDVDAIPYRPRTRVPAAGGGPIRLMAIGRFSEKKGFGFAVEGLHLLRERGVDARLDLFGDGVERRALEARIRELDLGARVTLHGSVDNTRAMAELAHHDVLCVPSVTPSDGNREGLPTVIHEGMCAGIPIVATRHGGIPESIEHERTGLLTDERDVVGLADAIERLGREPSLVERISAEARAFVERERSLPRSVEQVESAYDEARGPRRA